MLTAPTISPEASRIGNRLRAAVDDGRVAHGRGIPVGLETSEASWV
jgi:hypothetical protein